MSRLSLELKMIVRVGRSFKNERLKPLGVDSLDAELLLAVARKPDTTQDQLCAERLLNKSTVTRRLAFLEEQGLVCRTVCPDDRRANRIRLTGEGEALVPRLRKVNEEWSAFLTQSLTAEQTETLQATLEQILENSRRNGKEGEAT